MTTISPTLPDLLVWLEELRGRGQVTHDDEQQCWFVLGHPEVSQVLSTPRAFSSDLTALQPDNEDLRLFQRGNFFGMDDPQHRKLRSLASQAFTPKMVARMAPRITELATGLLDFTEGSTRVDLIRDFAHPLPVIVIAELIGIPIADQALFRSWADVLVNEDRGPDVTVDDEAMNKIAPTVREMINYLLDFIRFRQANPGEDLTSKLVQAEVDGDRLTPGEIVGFIGLLLIAGHITTTATLGNSIISFDENPDAFTEVRADRALLPAAIEEVVRHRSPFPRVTRMTKSEVELGGSVLPAGQVVVAWLTAANRDERVFVDADRFDIHRKPNPHLAFGQGIHFCLGAPLARLETKIALELLLARYRHIAIASDAPVVHRNPWATVGATQLPVEVRPA